MTLGIRTVAATLNEKGVDSNLAEEALRRGVQLFAKLCQAKVASKVYDIYPNPNKPKTIKISFQLIKEYLGVPIQITNVVRILQSLGFSTQSTNSNQQLAITVPSWRTNDVGIPQDIIEEVARIYGYHNLPSVLPQGELPVRPTGQSFALEDKIKTYLANCGYTETYSYAMQSKTELENCLLNPTDHLKIANPLTEDWLFMRRSLIPSVLSIIAQNQDISEQIKIFQMGIVYFRNKNNLPNENLRLVIAQSGKNQFFNLKGILETLFSKINLLTYNFYPSEKALIYDGKKQANILISGKSVGKIGELSNQIIIYFKLKEPVTIVDIDLASLLEYRSSTKPYQPISLYPSIVEDLTFSLKPQIYCDQIIQLVKSQSPLIRNVHLKGVYQQNYTLRVIYQHLQKNLSSSDVSQIRTKIISAVREKGWGTLTEKVKD